MIKGLHRGVFMGALAAVAIVGLAAGWGLRTAVGEVTPPTVDKGISRHGTVEVDLGPELAGYKMRLNVVTFEPGAVRAIHDHKQNPEAAYILQGTLSEYQRGGVMEEFAQGATRGNDRKVEHWLENHGSGKAMQVSVTVVKAH